MNNPFGQALLDFQNNCATANLETWSSVAGKDVMPLDYLFRSYKKMPKIEQKALDLCKGNILDIGCGAGSHSIYLQEKGFDVTSLDISKGAVEVCKLRGLKKVLQQDFWHIKNQKYDTILLLMNGIGLGGTLANLPEFLNYLKGLLNPKGQILVDSSDIIYMFKTDEGSFEIPEDNYYGKVQFTMTYKNQTTPQFNWLYLDYDNLKMYSEQSGFNCQKILNGAHYDYLARLSI